MAHSPSFVDMSDELNDARFAVPASAAAAASASPPAAAAAAAAARAFSPIDDLSGSEFAGSPPPHIPAAEDLSRLLSSPDVSPSRSYEEIGSDHDDDDRASPVIAASSPNHSAYDDDDKEEEVADDDELTILAVRRALHIPAHPQRRPPPRRIVHSPVNLLDDDDESPPAPAAAAAGATSSSSAAAAAAAASEEEADVCAICLSAPTELCVPSACKHPFCYACLEQWTKIQMTSIYAAAEQARYNEAMGGWVAQGSSANKDKKTHPSCPMCKREYTALRRMVVITAPGAVAPSPPPLPTVDSPFESIAVSLIVPPPFQYHRPTLSFNNPAYAHNEHFRQAAEAALSFALRTGAGLARGMLAGALSNHPRVNALLLAFPPYRENLQQIKKDLIDQVLATRETYNRRMGVQAQQQQSYQRHRQQQLAMDHGGGLMPEPLPMMNDSNATAYLLNRLGPQGSAALLSVAFGQESSLAPVTNPILQLYRESRYQGGMTHQLGRMRLWADLSIQHVPPQPDVIWALRQAGVGRGNRTPFVSAATGDQAAAAASSSSAAAASSSSSSSAAAAAASPPTLTTWLNVELSSILATRHEALSPATHEHFLVSLVLSYLELLLSRLEIEERQQKMERENREQGQQRRKKQRLERAAAAAAGASSSLEASSSSSSAAAATAGSPAPPTASRSMPPPLSNSFVPSYRASSSSLHPVSDDAPTQLASIEAAGAPDPNEVQILRERRREPTGPRRSPSEAEIIHLSDDDDNAGGAEPEILQSSSSSSAAAAAARRSPVQSAAHLPGGHLHSLFALSAPLSSAVDFLFHKLEEFLKGLTGVFVHRTLLWILSRAYDAPGAGPAVGDPRRMPTAEEVRARQLIESTMADALQQARERWRMSRGGGFGENIQAASASPVIAAAAAAASSSPPASSSSSAAAAAAPAAVAMSDSDDAVMPSSASGSRLHRSSSSSIREKRAARLGQRAARSDREQNQAERATSPAAAAAASSSSSSRPRPAASGFMASVFGSSAAAARPPAPAASSFSSSAARPLRPPPSVASSPDRSPSNSSSGSSSSVAQAASNDSPAPALSPLHFAGPDAEVLASAERRYTEEDNAFISGMRSSKRPRAHALEV